MFKQKKDKSLILLRAIAFNLQKGADCFAESKRQNAGDLTSLSADLKKLKAKGTEYINKLVQELNDTFITPIDREDILSLAVSMDIVLEKLETAAAFCNAYVFIQTNAYLQKYTAALCSCTDEIAKSVELLSFKKLPALHAHTSKIKSFKVDCNNLYLQANKELFSVEKDPVRLMKVKEIYKTLKDTADSCQNVANILEAIMIKNT